MTADRFDAHQEIWQPAINLLAIWRCTKGERLGRGPLPLLCNVRLAMACVLHMSGAVEAVMQLKVDSKDSDTPHAYVASDYFLDILDTKLHLQSIHV